MLEEIRKYDNLGTPAYFWELFEQLKSDSLWKASQISEYFLNRIIDGRGIFDGCVPLLICAGIISVDENDFVDVESGYKDIFHTERFFKGKLLEGFLMALVQDENCYDIFRPEHISYDFVYRSIVIDFSAFGLKYSSIRKLLIDFSFIERHPDFPDKKLIISPRWKRFFEERFGSEIRKRKIGIEELKKQREQQSINGEIAEKFILEFESIRLGNKEGIQWVAPYDSGAGYDILSFKTTSSNENDRYIEVKGYSGETPYFYWTKNEIDVARELAENYFIYLVNRDEIENSDYEPEMISNPVKSILESDGWYKEIDKYYIRQVEDCEESLAQGVNQQAGCY